MAGRQCQTDDGSCINFFSGALQTLPICEYYNGQWSISHWKIQNPDRTQLCLHFYFLGYSSSTLEVCEDLSTDCLQMAIRRFVSRWGYPDVIDSDNGKNFVGANQAMNLNFQKNYKPENNYIRLQLAQQNIQWTFNPPLASHFKGVWERLIQSAKWSLLVVLGSSRLNISVFHTVVAEAQRILNSRPLAHVGSTLIEEEPLTPNHFLMRRGHFCLKPLANSRTRFSIKDFKESQTLFEHYWSRLLKGFVPELNRRTKCQQANTELKESDVVWLYKYFTPRGIGPIGRIVKAHVSRDGVARSFDIKTSTGMVKRPAVGLGKVFETDNKSSSSLAAEVEWILLQSCQTDA